MIYSHSAFPSLRILSHWTVIDGLRAVKGSPHVPLSYNPLLLRTHAGVAGVSGGKVKLQQP